MKDSKKNTSKMASYQYSSITDGEVPSEPSSNGGFRITKKQKVNFALDFLTEPSAVKKRALLFVIMAGLLAGALLTANQKNEDFPDTKMMDVSETEMAGTAASLNTIGVSVYNLQWGLWTLGGKILQGHYAFEEMSRMSRFPHMGVFHLPYDYRDLNQKEYAYMCRGQDGPSDTDAPSQNIGASVHIDTSCDDTELTNFPKIAQAYDKKGYFDVTGKGFEVTLSNGIGLPYNQVLGIGAPTRYIRGSGSSSEVWVPGASMTLMIATDLTAKEFYMAADKIARQMNHEGGYGLDHNCQDFSLRLMKLLGLPKKMVGWAEDHHMQALEKTGAKFLCSATPAAFSQHCKNTGWTYHYDHIPSACSANTKFDVTRVPNYYGDPNRCWADDACTSSDSWCEFGYSGCENCCNSFHDCWFNECTCWEVDKNNKSPPPKN